MTPCLAHHDAVPCVLTDEHEVHEDAEGTTWIRNAEPLPELGPVDLTPLWCWVPRIFFLEAE